jgi:RNA polymerase sigma-70 factor (ECF subfamily)
LTGDSKALENLAQAVIAPNFEEEAVDAGIWMAVESLPRHYAKPLLLASLDELSYREIAAITDCPIGTVMSRISRGRELLRRSLVEIAGGRGILRKT